MPTRTLAAFATAALTPPQPVLNAARDALIDTLGVAIAGSAEPVAALIAPTLGADIGAGGCTVIGGAARLPAAAAAMANGIAAHALDFDDSLPSSRSHPSAPLLPAILAVAELTDAPGHEVLTALAVGIEVTGRLGRLFGTQHYLRGWHSTATIGTFAATAAAARLWKLSAEELCTAWGIAASQAGGLVRNFGTMTKPFHVGNAARIGVLSAELARSGFTADPAILDGPDGFLALYCGDDGQPPPVALEGLGSRWDLLDPGLCVKRWPCCYCNHRPIGALLELIARHDIRADEVTAIRVGFPPGADRALIKGLPTTALEAKFSIHFALATTILDGDPTLATFATQVLARPDVQAMMRRVQPYDIPDRGVYSGISGYNVVAVETPRGTFQMRIDRVPGSIEWPLTAAERDEKFLGCARTLLAEGEARSLLGALDRIQDAPALADLIRGLGAR